MGRIGLRPGYRIVVFRQMSIHCKIQLYLGFLMTFIFLVFVTSTALTPTNNINKEARIMKLETSLDISTRVIASKRDTAYMV